MGKRIGRVKIRKVMAWDKGVFRKKAAHKIEAKQGIHSPFPMSRQMFSNPCESRAPSSWMVTWEGKYCHSKHPDSLFFPHCVVTLHSDHKTIGSRITLWSAEVSCPGSFPPLSLCSPSLLPGGVVPEAGKSLMLWKSCSAIRKHLYITNTIFSINQ